MLMDHGARLDLQDELKRTPFDLAGPALKEALLCMWHRLFATV